MYESYKSFASVYDSFMDETDYELLAEQIRNLIGKYGLSKPAQERTGASESADVLLAAEKNLVVDLGCGTGKLTEIMAGYGYDMMGLDLSEDMLSIAIERRDKFGHKTMYLCQDMRSFELYGTAGTFLSVGDSINYLTSDRDLDKLFRRVNTFLFPRGIFIFDFKTIHFFRDVVGDRIIAEDREDCSFIWDNSYDEKTDINEYDLSLFLRDDSAGAADNAFRKFEEVHRQRGYTLEHIRETAVRAGLSFVAALDRDTGGSASEKSERILCVVQEKDKKIPPSMAR